MFQRSHRCMLAFFFMLATSSAWSNGPGNRRAFFERTAAAAAGVAVAVQSVAPANAASLPSPTELERLQKGHARVQYLIKEWDKETQVCGKMVMSDNERKQVVQTDGQGRSGCEKTPLKVQNYMGYKSTDDPLFKADKLMIRAAPLVDPDDFENYLEAVETFKDKADSTAMMAYTSSWGEANPNGGKDVIDEYLERTRLDVEDSEKALRAILGYLKLEPLAASKSP